MIGIGSILGTFCKSELRYQDKNLIENHFHLAVSFLYKYLNRQLVITVLLALMSISLTAIPFTTNLILFYGCALAFGTCLGAWVAAYNVWLIEIWQKNSSKALFVSQLMYGSGSVLGPLIDSPFLTGEPKNTTDSALVDNFHNSSVISAEERRIKLEVPFMIAGGLQLICKKKEHDHY